MYITSSLAFIVYSVVMVGVYLISTWFTNAPFLAFATQFTMGFIAYITKRLIKSRNNFKGDKR